MSDIINPLLKSIILINLALMGMVYFLNNWKNDGKTILYFLKFIL